MTLKIRKVYKGLLVLERYVPIINADHTKSSFKIYLKSSTFFRTVIAILDKVDYNIV